MRNFCSFTSPYQKLPRQSVGSMYTKSHQLCQALSRTLAFSTSSIALDLRRGPCFQLKTQGSTLIRTCANPANLHYDLHHVTVHTSLLTWGMSHQAQTQSPNLVRESAGSRAVTLSACPEQAKFPAVRLSDHRSMMLYVSRKPWAATPISVMARLQRSAFGGFLGL